MKNKEETREFSFDDATLIQKCDGVHDSLTRDQADLAYRNITAAVLGAFMNQIDDFRDTDTDPEWVGQITTIVEEKDALRTQIQIQISTISNMAQNAFGRGKGKYNTFKFDGINDLPDANFARAARRINRVGNMLLAELATEGLTVDILDTLLADANSFDRKIDLVEEKEEQRDLATKNRVTKANALYKTLARLAGIGKNHFFSRDEAKYNDYVIYEGDTPEGFTAITVNLAPGGIVTQIINLPYKAPRKIRITTPQDFQIALSSDGMNPSGSWQNIPAGNQNGEIQNLGASGDFIIALHYNPTPFNITFEYEI